MKKFVTIIALLMVMEMSVGLLTACGVDIDTAKDKLEESDYTVVVIGYGETEADSDYEGVVRMLTATDISLSNLFESNSVTILEFTDTDTRDEVFAELEGDDEDYVCKISGMCIVFGTEEAVDIVL